MTTYKDAMYVYYIYRLVRRKDFDEADEEVDFVCMPDKEDEEDLEEEVVVLFWADNQECRSIQELAENARSDKQSRLILQFYRSDVQHAVFFVPPNVCNILLLLLSALSMKSWGRLALIPVTDLFPFFVIDPVSLPSPPPIATVLSLVLVLHSQLCMCLRFYDT